MVEKIGKRVLRGRCAQNVFWPSQKIFGLAQKVCVLPCCRSRKIFYSITGPLLTKTEAVVLIENIRFGTEGMRFTMLSEQKNILFNNRANAYKNGGGSSNREALAKAQS